MKVMVLVKASTDTEAGRLPPRELVAAMSQYNEALIKAGILLAAEGLRPSRDGKRVRFSGTRRSVEDGPFGQTQELVSGFWLWQVRSIEEAVEWVKRCPNLPTDSAIEIRPIFEAADLEEALTLEPAPTERSQRGRSTPPS